MNKKLELLSKFPQPRIFGKPSTKKQFTEVITDFQVSLSMKVNYNTQVKYSQNIKLKRYFNYLFLI